MIFHFQRPKCKQIYALYAIRVKMSLDCVFFLSRFASLLPKNTTAGLLAKTKLQPLPMNTQRTLNEGKLLLANNAVEAILWLLSMDLLILSWTLTS